MEFLNTVLLQIDEGCRHVADGRLAQLRLALLLLDNVAEIQMQRCATDHIWRELSQEKMKNFALQIPVDRQSEYWKELVEWQPLTYNDKLNISRNFDDKAKYLSGRVSVLDSRLVGPLIYLHRYRNEAYHSARIRKETIDTAARLLVEINCILLENLSRSFISYGSGDDYSWLKERFGQNPVDLFNNSTNLVSMAVNAFRSIVSHNEETVKTVLYDHLVSRIEETHDGFFVELSG